jgi:dipeptidase E
MKLLLTSGGVTNASIHSALVRLLGKPVTESRALCVPTAQWGHPMCNPTSVQGFTAAGSRWRHSSGLGWASLGVLELTALPTIGHERWLPWVQEADVLLVDGGDATYLSHWMRESGLADLLPSLTDTVWVGISAGSMVMTPRIGQDFVEWPAAPDDRTLGVVDFAIFPHLEAFPTNTMSHADDGLRPSTGASTSSRKVSGSSSSRARPAVALPTPSTPETLLRRCVLASQEGQPTATLPLTEVRCEVRRVALTPLAVGRCGPGHFSCPRTSPPGKVGVWTLT